MTTKKNLGKFAWHELHSTDPKASIKFYTELFGWKTSEMDMGPMGTYTIFKHGDGNEQSEQIGGCMKAQGGAPTHWLAYATVESVDGASEKAKSLGGTILVPPTDIPNVGRFSIIKDVQGAVLATFTTTGTGSEDTSQHLGHFCWDELMTSDPDAAAKFYGAIYGWTVKPPKKDDKHPYWHWQRADGKDHGGMMKADGGMPTAWLSYIAVANVDTASAKAQGLGAKAIVEPMDIPGTGRFAVLKDPIGGVFALYKTAAH